MMDGQVAAIRAALDGAGHDQVAILAYAAKYASALYGPFRDAVDVTIAGGGDAGLPAGPAQPPRGAAEIALDVAEGADMVMVKPAMTSLDVIADGAPPGRRALAAYHVSGEYAMVQAAAAAGWIDGPAVALEQLTGHQAGRGRLHPHLLRGRGGRGPRWLTGPPAANAAWFAGPGG
jgi:porphobilinogen synthase